MQFRVRTTMIAVAGAGLVLGLIVHVRSLKQAEGEFAGAVLMLEGIAAAVLLTIALGIGFVVRLGRKDDAYAVRLRRDSFPAYCPSPPMETMSDQK